MADEWVIDPEDDAAWALSQNNSNAQWSTTPVDDGAPSVWTKQIPDGVNMTQAEYEQFLLAKGYAEEARAVYELTVTFRGELLAWYEQIDIWQAEIAVVNLNVNTLYQAMLGIENAVETDRQAVAADKIIVADDRAASALILGNVESARDTTLDYRNAAEGFRDTSSANAAATAADRATAENAAGATLILRDETEVLRDSTSGHRAAAQSAATSADEDADQTALDRAAVSADMATTLGYRNAAEAFAAAASTYDPAPFNAHLSNTANPHAVTKTQVGLGNADNTSDANKPVSTAQQTALNLKANLASPALTGNPTAPTQTAGNNSTRLATTAFVTAANNALTKTSVGLGNVDNTSDVNKPISTAQAAGLDLKLDKTGGLLSDTVDFNKTLSAANKLLGLMQGYDIYSDNVGTGSANSRLWLSTPDQGTVYIGPRAGAQALHSLYLRATQLFREAGTGALRILDTGDLATLFTQMGATGNNSSSGYIKFPTIPLIIQYGTLSVTAGNATLSYPVSFPNACRAIVGSVNSQVAGTVGFDSVGVSACAARTRDSAGVATGFTIFWIAAGY